MKKLLIYFLAIALGLVSLFSFASCDQESVDSTMDGVMSNAANALNPFFKQNESTGGDSTTGSEDDEKNPDNGTSQEKGNQEGDLCYGYDLEMFTSQGVLSTTANPANNKGKITVISFFNSTSPDCNKHFEALTSVSEDYSTSVSVFAIHSTEGFESAPDFVANSFDDSKIVFLKDEGTGEIGSSDVYYALLTGGSDVGYPYTVILDENGIIVAKMQGVLATNQLLTIIDSLLSE